MKPQLMRNLAGSGAGRTYRGSAESVCGLKHGDPVWLKYSPTNAWFPIGRSGCAGTNEAIWMASICICFGNRLLLRFSAGARRHPDASLVLGLCQPPSEAMIVSASFGPQLPRLIGANAVVCFQDWIDHRPGGLHCVLAGEERSIAGHGVAQKPLVGRFLSRSVLRAGRALAARRRTPSRRA